MLGDIKPAVSRRQRWNLVLSCRDIACGTLLLAVRTRGRLARTTGDEIIVGCVKMGLPVAFCP